MRAWRMFLFSGLISVFIGILYITSMLETKVSGLNLWGYFLLFWGISVTLISFNRLALQWLIKVLTAIGIMLHGSLALYWLLFPGGPENHTSGNTYNFYAVCSILVAVFCMFILGTKVGKSSSKQHCK